MMIAGAIFRRLGWDDFSYGHAKIFGIILWHYEATKKYVFKYSRLLRRHGYGKTQNYKLIKDLIDRKIIRRRLFGEYEIRQENSRIIDDAIATANTFTGSGKK